MATSDLREHLNIIDVDDLAVEVESIESRLSEINRSIRQLEHEKRELVTRKTECLELIKQSKPSSSGGVQKDTTEEWSRQVNVTMSAKDCICIMPTGGGKSLCFQLPAVCDANCVTLVVSPLVSLVEDQLWMLHEFGIQADTLNGSSSKEKVKQIHEAMLDKANTQLRLLYVTPEKLAKSKMFMNKLQRMYELGRFKRLVVDEVHCCSTFGHDFRPDYKFLNVMKSLFPNICILGLTATATQSVIDDVKRILNIERCILFKASFNRPNIFYQVRGKSAVLETCMSEMADLIHRQFSGESGIVYCLAQRDCEQVAQELSSRGVRADAYHANMESERRSRIHERWLKNKTLVIVATIAFGMGIDKANCRFVIHHSLSKSLENFYQESGRAGRDGQRAHSILFFRFADVFRQSSMVFTEQTGLANLYSIVNYCIDQRTCKRTLIARHFNDQSWEERSCNGMCDTCSQTSTAHDRIERIDCQDECKLVLALAHRQEKNVTANKLAELSLTEIKRNKPSSPLVKCPSHIERLLLCMLMNEYLKEDFHFTPYSTICYLVCGRRASEIHTSKTARFMLDLVNVVISTKRGKNNLNNKEEEDILREAPVRKKKKSKTTAEQDEDEEIFCLDD